jgi:predicted short-subunit dehydrogenase-like oxidoreductase (DUF2520 family)
VGSLHPVRSLEDPAQVVRDFKGTFCGYEGDGAALPRIRKIIRDIGGVGFKIAKGRKVFYHVGSVLVSNYLASLMEIGIELFRFSGIKKGKAIKILYRLAMGTLENIKRLGLPKALTGPIERGDIKTIDLHMDALEKKGIFSEVYSILGEIALKIARRKGTISKEKAELIEERFAGWRKKEGLKI